MNWPIENDERVRARGFSILDDDFGFMARDLAGNIRKDQQSNMIGASLASALRIAKSYWQRSIHLNVTRYLTLRSRA
jgi:hypothetical protein